MITKIVWCISFKKQEWKQPVCQVYKRSYWIGIFGERLISDLYKTFYAMGKKKQQKKTNKQTKKKKQKKKKHEVIFSRNIKIWDLRSVRSNIRSKIILMNSNIKLLFAIKYMDKFLQLTHFPTFTMCTAIFWHSFILTVWISSNKHLQKKKKKKKKKKIQNVIQIWDFSWMLGVQSYEICKTEETKSKDVFFRLTIALNKRWGCTKVLQRDYGSYGTSSCHSEKMAESQVISSWYLFFTHVVIFTAVIFPSTPKPL